MAGIESSQHEVIMAGVGGGGVLTAGRLLATAAMARFQYSLWYPTYASATRGGPCECTVTFSDDEIYSPLLDQSQVVLVLHPSQLKPFEHRVRPQGLVLVETFGLKDRLDRGDVQVIEVPAIETALATVGTVLGANLILLGAYVKTTGSLPPELVEEVIQNRFKGRPQVLETNMAAFREGLKLAASWAK